MDKIIPKKLNEKEAEELKEALKRKYTGRYSKRVGGIIMDEKLCKDCLYNQGKGWMTTGCIRSDVGKNPITGEKLYSFCLVERSYRWLSAILFGHCGKSGRYFTKKLFNPPRINEGGKGERK